MADLETLTMTVETTAGESDDALKRVTSGLKKMKAALEGIDTKGLSDVARGMREISQSTEQSGIKKTANEIKKQVSGLTALKKNLDFAKGFASGGFKSAKTFVTGLAGATKKLTNAFGLNAIASGKFVSSLARIAGYRAIRTIISSITRGAATGLENLAHASAEANATLSQLSSGALTLQNAMGGALYSVLASIIGVLNTIVSAAVTAINWISMLFAILGGRATFKKATSATKEYASALGGAAGGAKALKQELMGFDEINSLSPETGGGGGGGGAGALDYGSMFEETPVSESLKDMVDKADFTVLGQSLANKVNAALGNIKWPKVQAGAYKFARSLVTFLNGFIGTVDAGLVGDAIAGLVTSGLTTINTIAYDTNWFMFGNKIKVAIRTAISKIPPQSVGNAITARLNMAIDTFLGMLPATGEEWAEVTDWVAACATASIDAVNEDALGEVVGRVITGGLNAVISLGEAGAISSLAGKVFGAIEAAIEEVNEDDIRHAIEVLLEEALKIGSLLIDLVIDIGNTTLGNALTFAALYNALKPALKEGGINGWFKGPGGALKLTGAITMAIDAVAGIADILEGGLSGKEIAAKLADVFNSIMMSAGFVIMNANPAGGVIIVGLGLAIKLIASIELEDYAYEIEQITSVFGEAGMAAISSAKNLEALQNVFSNLSGVEVDASTFDALLRSAGGIEEAAPAIEQYRSAMINLLSSFADLNAQGLELNFADYIQETIDSLGSYQVTTDEAKTATESFATVAEKAGEAASAISDATSGIDAIKTDLNEVAANMQATGEDATALKEKIIEIPSDIVYNLELNNFDAVIGQFGTLKSTADEVAGSVKGSFTGINWFNIGYQVANAFKRGLKSIKMPKMSVTWTNNTKMASLLGKNYSLSIPTPTIKMYAKGGFPDAGEVFMANENGKQELVGRIGNKPAVANQDQIGDAIFKYMDAHNEQDGGMDYGAMANALVGAMKAAGLGALYIDGQMIKKSLNKEAQRSGRPALGY